MTYTVVALLWWLKRQGKAPTFTTSNNCITSWSVPGVQQPTQEQIEQIVKDYLNSQQYAKDGFSYELCMEDLNRTFWTRMTQLAPVVGLIDLWTRWKNFSALKIKGLQWIEDGTLTQADFDTMNSVYKKQGIDLMLW